MARLRRRQPSTPTPTPPLRVVLRDPGAALSQTSLKSAAPTWGAFCPAPPRCAAPGQSASSAGNARRLTRVRRPCDRPLLLATPGDSHASCSARTPCNKSCSPGWAETKQERMDLTLSRTAPLLPPRPASSVKFDLGGANLVQSSSQESRDSTRILPEQEVPSSRL
ncbi:hypothetical protein ZWY2020_007603 [Hordeum vulgare]|nr:hypothetical protein ZWY2020_007603 [Hordeum vulgare]